MILAIRSNFPVILKFYIDLYKISDAKDNWDISCWPMNFHKISVFERFLIFQQTSEYPHYKQIANAC